ncbi:MAG: hypothetical protein WBE26_00015 [Phycisphaerae bacterium]
MKSRIAFGLLCLPFSWTIGGCLTAADHASQLHSAQERKLTVGVVQKEIREGMSQADVAAALGSPNIVTKDSGGTEAWIYDKIATEASYSNDSSGIGGMVGAGGLPSGRSLVLGGVGAGHRRSAGASATTQRTLTVIIKFNDAGNVADFSYHSSTF